MVIEKDMKIYPFQKSNYILEPSNIIPGENGLPGNLLAGPISANALTGQWAVVDLSEHDIRVDGDFYIVYVQT